MPGADDPSLQFDEKPQETYPKTYIPPDAPPLDTFEERSVAAFVAFRKSFHSTPFYTHRHLTTTIDEAATSKPTDPVRRTYGQAQINARFGVKSRATVDPFRAVPLYSNKFEDQTRSLPELKRRADKYVKAFFPEELWATLYGRDTGGPKGGYLSTGNGVVHGKRGTKRKAVVVDGDPFASDDDVEGLASRRRREDETEEERKARIEAALKEGDNEDAENKEDIDLDEEEEELSQEDDDYGDDEGGDYDAEAYFDGGDADDFGDDEGVGESAMDF